MLKATSFLVYASTRAYFSPHPEHIPTTIASPRLVCCRRKSKQCYRSIRRITVLPWRCNHMGAIRHRQYYIAHRAFSSRNLIIQHSLSQTCHESLLSRHFAVAGMVLTIRLPTARNTNRNSYQSSWLCVKKDSSSQSRSRVSSASTQYGGNFTHWKLMTGYTTQDDRY